MLVTFDNRWLHWFILGMAELLFCILNFSSKIKVIGQEEGDGKNLAKKQKSLSTSATGFVLDFLYGTTKEAH